MLAVGLCRVDQVSGLLDVTGDCCARWLFSSGSQLFALYNFNFDRLGLFLILLLSPPRHTQSTTDTCGERRAQSVNLGAARLRHVHVHISVHVSESDQIITERSSTIAGSCLCLAECGADRAAAACRSGPAVLAAASCRIIILKRSIPSSFSFLSGACRVQSSIAPASLGFSNRFHMPCVLLLRHRHIPLTLPVSHV